MLDQVFEPRLIFQIAGTQKCRFRVRKRLLDIVFLGIVFKSPPLVVRLRPFVQRLGLPGRINVRDCSR
jgi:hypothetical protein